MGGGHLHLHRHLRQDAGGLFDRVYCAYSHGDDDGQGVRRHGAELPTQPLGACVPGISHHCLRSHLRCVGAEYSARRGRFKSHLDVHGLYRAAVFHAV